jgi:hypothetical protein
MQQAVQPEIQQTVQSDVQQAAQPELHVALPDVSQAVQPDKQMDLQSVANPQTSSQQSPFSKHLAMPKPKTEKRLRKLSCQRQLLVRHLER